MSHPHATPYTASYHPYGYYAPPATHTQHYQATLPPPPAFYPYGYPNPYQSYSVPQCYAQHQLVRLPPSPEPSECSESSSGSSSSSSSSSDSDGSSESSDAKPKPLRHNCEGRLDEITSVIEVEDLPPGATLYCLNGKYVAGNRREGVFSPLDEVVSTSIELASVESWLTECCR